MLILHLSDIHFRKAEVETAQDPNFHLRNEVVRDVADQCRTLGAPDAVIVSGDVAYGGDPAEYRFASDWLLKLCEACEASLESVFVIPGNHDVAWEVADRNLVQMIHDRIKAATDPFGEISKQLLDKDAGRLLYESIDNYNGFAFQFLCDLLPPDRTRATRDLPLGDGSTLRVWGLNTAFVSSRADKQGDLFVDTASVQIPRDAGVTNLVAAHHHPSWLRQSGPVEDHLGDVAAVQMFGHVHTNRINRDVKYMRLTASAVQPERHEAAWEPGYNLLELDVAGEGEERRLEMKAHVRVWQASPGGFVAKMDGRSPFFAHSVKLDAWRRPAAASAAVSSGTAARERDANVDGSAPVREAAMDELRELGLRFYRLTFSKKAEIAGSLALLEEEDTRQPDYERFRRVFLRAQESGRLGELAEAIRAADK